MTPERSRLIQEDFAQQVKAGLAQDRENSTLLMLPSWLSELPTGLEAGDAIAIDVGGTSFRVMHVELGGERSAVVRVTLVQTLCF